MNDGSISSELEQFLGAYFHQDWDLEADDWQGIVDNYVNANPVAELLRVLAHEIDDVRASGSEPDLAQFLIRGVGICYDPPCGSHLQRVARSNRCTVAQACQRD